VESGLFSDRRLMAANERRLQLIPMKEQTFLILAVLFLAALQVAFHYFLKWRLRIDPGVEQTRSAAVSPEFTRCQQRLAKVAKVQSHIGIVFGIWLSLFLAAVCRTAVAGDTAMAARSNVERVVAGCGKRRAQHLVHAFLVGVAVLRLRLGEPSERGQITGAV
jgi:hypothetical protein